MASSVIHMVIANEINKKLKRDNSILLIGSIAPDLAKQLGKSKDISHFIDGEKNIPNLELFLNKYKSKLKDDFVMGYYIHLYTDYLWFKYFLTEIHINNSIIKMDGTVLDNISEEQFIYYVYNDYTNMNISLLEKYDMDLDIFFNTVPELDNIIEEIPMDKIDVIINKTAEIIDNSKLNKDYLFNMENVNVFIKTSVELILSKIDEMNI